MILPADFKLQQIPIRYARYNHLLYAPAMVYDLQRFKKVVETGSISKASRLLFVSQPALSKSLRVLEEYYGVDLLERFASGVKPTAYGTILYQAACEMEKLSLEIENQILHEKSVREPFPGRKEIHLGCSTIWSELLLPEVMRRIEGIDAYEIHVTNDTSEQLLHDLLETDRFDFVLCRILEEEKYKHLCYVPLLKSQPAIFVNSQHPLVKNGIDRKKLEQLRWVKLKSLPPLRHSDVTSAGLSLLPKSFFRPAISFEVQDLMAAVQLLRNDYAIVLPLALAGLVEKYNVKPLPFPKTLTNAYWLGMAHSREVEMPLHVRELMNRIRMLLSSEPFS